MLNLNRIKPFARLKLEKGMEGIHYGFKYTFEDGTTEEYVICALTDFGVFTMAPCSPGIVRDLLPEGFNFAELYHPCATKQYFTIAMDTHIPLSIEKIFDTSAILRRDDPEINKNLKKHFEEEMKEYEKEYEKQDSSLPKSEFIEMMKLAFKEAFTDATKH